MANKYDLVVLGSGPGGYIAALKGAAQGMKVAIVEKQYFGGTCLNVGCIPTKALIASAEQYTSFKKNRDFGISTEGNISYDFEKIMARKTRIVKQLNSSVEMLMKKGDIDIYFGKGTLKNENTISVELDSGNEDVTSEAIILATGSVISDPPIKGADGINILNSDQLLSIDHVPSSLTIIGAGAIGTEFAYVFNSLGTKVNIIEWMPHILPLEDKEIADTLTASYKKNGIKIFTGAAVNEILDENNEKVVRYTHDGEEKSVSSEIVLIATGRKPLIEGVGFENIPLTIEKRAVKVDEYLYTGVGKIYAIGDCIGGLMLAHKASADAEVAVNNISGKKMKVDYRAIPRVVYCHPEVATVGMTKEQAEENGIEVISASYPFMAMPRALIMGDREGFLKIIARKSDSVIIGAFAIGPHTTEMITEMTLAIQKELTVGDICETVHPHPSLAEIFHEAANAVTNSPF